MNIPISYKTLSRYLDDIPNPSGLSDILFAHVCEVEGLEIRNDDTIFDLKITPDRGDLLSYRGIAREISVHSNAKLKISEPKVSVSELATKLIVEVLEPKSCSRYTARVIEGVDGRPSPAWLKEALEASGQRSINAIVDVTNFVMLELGQPMHAFDADKLACTSKGEIKIIVRNASKGEEIETLDGKNITLSENTLVVADSTRALALAGVKGGAHAGVGEKVNTIVLESAIFSPALVRKASAVVNIRTDSSRRFEHGRAPEIARIAIDRATELLLQIFPDAQAGEVVDIYPHPANPYKVSMTSNDITRILGISFSHDDMERDLTRFGFKYEHIKNPLEKILSRARELVGTPYFYGASVLFDAPQRLDCSGFVCYIFLEAGIKIPRISVDQYVFGEEVLFADIEAGDLVFSAGEGSTLYYESIEWMKGTKVPEKGIDHVGIYLGDGMIAHSSRYNTSMGKDGGVLIEKLKDSPRFKNLTGVRRILSIKEERFSVIAPPERFDIRIGADIAEEVARLIGYDHIPTTPLAIDGFTPSHNGMYNAMLRSRNTLSDFGFSEIFTYAFRKEGKVEIVNPMAEGINFLRDNLSDGMRDALVFNARNAPLLGLDEIMMFEIGTVFFAPDNEAVHLSLGVSVTKNIKQSKKEARESELLTQAREALATSLGVSMLEWKKEGNVCELTIPSVPESETNYTPLIPSFTPGVYKRISAYPFVLRDIAVWAPEGIFQSQILAIIKKEGSGLLIHERLFDVFTKEFNDVKKTSYAFNLVFQSPERTLSDVEINEIMTRITTKLSEHGLEVR